MSSVSGPTGVNNFVDKNVDKHNVESQPTNDYQDEEDEENEEERETAAPPGVYLTNILSAPFLYESVFETFL